MIELDQKSKLAPHSLEAEKSFLGCLIIDNSAWDKISDKIVDLDFYFLKHRHIFIAIKFLINKDSVIDIITLSEILELQNKLETIGGLNYLADIARNTPSANNIIAYAEIILDKSTIRKLIKSANKILNNAFNPNGVTSNDLLNEAESLIFKISEKCTKFNEPIGINKLLTKTLDRIDNLYNMKNSISGLSTGFKDFDKITSGLQSSDLIIIAGRPSMGKTTFAMNIVENTIVNTEKLVIVFSLEMPSDHLIVRIISSLGNIDQMHIRTGQLNDNDWERLTTTVNLLRDRKLFIDDTPAISPSEIRNKIRRLSRDIGVNIGLIIIDYLQLMEVHGISENRTAEISEITRSLKVIAKEFNCPVVALSQLNRSLEQRPNKRPIMSDLRESGAIEQDADLIIFIYRDEVYNRDNIDNKGIAEIIIGKQRNGPIGIVPITFIGKYTKFENI
ncbi:DNA helicase DnaB [Candidatus Johnevansia muelleri]|uniref:Replicative DNA helicase n=1 Tax=Candidatus Johnevansia muelleri TaxID=1495769 RepID=A0A078KBP6_9GAMM|nr:DNA helicase DnaB [Candidatus Evansia muelleri]